MNTNVEPPARIPRGCTFSESDWLALAPHWYPVAFSSEVQTQPFAARLLDQRLAIFRTSNGNPVAVQDLCLHRGAPLSLGSVQATQVRGKSPGFRSDHHGHCVCTPANPDSPIPSKLKLRTFPVRERYGLIWTRLIDDGEKTFPAFDEWDDPQYLQVLPNAVELNASAGRQIEGFLDV